MVEPKAFPVTDQSQRIFQQFDASLELRAASAAAVTATAADLTAPDWQSSILDIGSGIYQAQVVIDNIVATYQAATGYSEIFITGLDTADTVIVTLASIYIGENEVIPNSADQLSGEIRLPFINLFNNVKFPHVRLNLVNHGTSPSVDFTAYITGIGQR